MANARLGGPEQYGLYAATSKYTQYTQAIREHISLRTSAHIVEAIVFAAEWTDNDATA